MPGSSGIPTLPFVDAPAAGPRYSPDGQWVWDGARWQPVLSADGTTRWNGFGWVAVPRPPGTYRLAVTSMIFGIAALMPVLAYPLVAAVVGMAGGLAVYSAFEPVAFFPALGVALSAGIVAIVSGSRGIKRLGRWRGIKSGRSMAWAGIICGITGLSLTPLLLLELVIFADA